MASRLNPSPAKEGLQEFLRSRRSVRRFRPETVPRGLIERILETAAWAPSAHNRQPWRFIVLETPTTRRRLAAAMGAPFLNDLLADGVARSDAERIVARSHDRIQAAPVAIVLCLDESVLDRYPDPERQGAEEIMGVQSVALAGGMLLLAAHAEGLGGVWMCAPLFAQDVVQTTLLIPESWRAQGLILLGYPEAIPEPRPRRPLREIVRFVP